MRVRATGIEMVSDLLPTLDCATSQSRFWQGIEETERTPVVDALADTTAVSLAERTLPARAQTIARIASLAAVGAPAVSYLLDTGAAAEVGLTLEVVQGVQVAVAAIVEIPRIVSAAANITKALGFVIALAEAEAEAELSAGLGEER